MRNIRFLQIKFFCYKKGTGRIINLDSDTVIIKGGNQSGRSSVMMSLYGTLGADIKTFSKQWTDDKIVTLLKISVDGAIFQFLHIGKMFYVYDVNGKEYYRAVNRTDNAAKLDSLFMFNLTFTDNKKERKRMPVEFMFLPFYISQDKGWDQPLRSFDGASTYGGKKNALYYYTGVIRDEYFQICNSLEETEDQIKKLGDKLEYDIEFSKYVRERIANSRISLTGIDFDKEQDEFLAKVNDLKKEQGKLMTELKKLYDKRAYLEFRKQQMHENLDEINKDLKFARQQKENITCPMCGAHVSNDAIGIYGMIEDRNMSKNAILEYEDSINVIDDKINNSEKKSELIRDEIVKLESRLAAKKNDVTLSQYLDSQMYVHLEDTLNERERNTRKEKAEKESVLYKQIEMAELYSGNDQKDMVEEDFLQYVVSAYRKMGISRFKQKDIKFGGKITETGSTVTRGIVAYTYAYCELIKKYNGRLFCPIVIDEPNQNGIDQLGLEGVVKFLLSDKPKGAQLILAVSNDAKIDDQNVTVIELEAKKELLIKDDFEAVRDEVETLLGENWEMVPYNS